MTLPRAPLLYRMLLRLVPQLRRRFGADLEADFCARLEEARGRGRVSVLRTWLSATADIAHESWRQIARQRRREPREEPRRLRWSTGTGADFRHALRLLVRQRTATVLVAGMLTLGIAANVAVFQLVDGLFLRPLPFPEPSRLVWINETAPRWNLEVVGVNYPDFAQWRSGQQVLEGIAVFEETNFNLAAAGAGGSAAERLPGALVSHDLAAVLGVPMALGRSFTAEEDRPGGPPVAVLSHPLWRDRFASDSAVLGRTLRVEGVERTVVGVLPEGVEFPAGARLWLPLAGDPNQPYQSYGATAIGRLRPGVDAPEAQSDLLRAHDPIFEERDNERTVTPIVRPLREVLVADYRSAAGLLGVAVGLLLVIACANVAAIVLARSSARRGELALRVAIGAGRLRLVRQLLIENLLLALGGAAAGLLGARLLIAGALRVGADEIPPWLQLSLGSRSLLFVAGIVVFCVLGFGLLPALVSLRYDLRSSLHGGSSRGSTAGVRGRRGLRLLVAGEFALAALLLVAGGLLVRAWEKVQSVDLGFRTEGVLTFGVSLPDATYRDEAERGAFWRQTIDDLGSLPGVEAAAAITCAPLGCHSGTFFLADDAPPPPPGTPNPVVLYRGASSAYSDVIGLRMRAGRFLEPRDDVTDAERVAVVNETFARTFWPGVEPAQVVGRRFRRPSSEADVPRITVVGVVGDIKHYGLEKPMRPGIYLPLAADPPSRMTLVVRAASDPQALIAPIRSRLHERDPDLGLYQVRTMEQAVSKSLRTRSVISLLLVVFATLAAVLALGGTYGVSSYLVAQRTREFGIHLALGADRRAVAGTVLRAGALTAAIGIACGVALSLAGGRWLDSWLFGVRPWDPAVLAAAIVTLVATALAANLAPAWRAARVDPMTTLRAD